MERKVEKVKRNIFVFVFICILCFESVFTVFAEKSDGSGQELTFSGLPFRLNREVTEGVSLSSTSSKNYEDNEDKGDYVSSFSEVPENEPIIEESYMEESFKGEQYIEETFATEEKDDEFFVQGLVSYQNKDWQGSTVFLRKAITEPKYNTAETLYLIIMSEMYAGDYASALSDSDSFLLEYQDSSLEKNVQYQRGRALHFVGQNDEAVLSLSDFCHQNQQSAMYPFALYWIAECFYDDYNFDTAKSLYEQIIFEYPDCKKAVDARFKLDAIAQREREEKLLALLKETSDDYLSACEDFEKQLKESETADIVMLRRQLNEANARIAELESYDEDERKKLEEYEKLLASQTALNDELKKMQEANEAQQKKLQEQQELQEQELSKEPVLEEKQEEIVDNLDDIDLLDDNIDPQTLAMIAKKRGISEEELLKLKIRAAQLQRLLDELYSNSNVDEGEW